MNDLPKPAFISDEEREVVAKVAQAGDAKVSDVEKAVVVAVPLLESDCVIVKYLEKEGDLLYHVWPGPMVATEYWGGGFFGLDVLSAAEESYPSVKPLVEFIQEVDSYCVTIPAINRRPLPPNEDTFRRFAEILDRKVGEGLAKGNGLAS
jgi:hypothetical protein